tara:strand:- start:1586 stop:2554 length:969 start_codon:yes stop_codon:yes gene_type:complete
VKSQNTTKKTFLPMVLLVVFFIVFLFIVEYFNTEPNVLNSILEQNKELSKVEAIDVAKELGCTRIVDLGDVFVPCSSIEEFDYALKIYNLKEKIQSQQRDNLISSLLIYLTISVIISLVGFIFLQSKRHENLKINSKNYLMPSEWVKAINSLENTVKDVSSKTIQTAINSDTVIEDFKSLKDIFLELQGKLNDQDREIERLKKGYDNHLVKKFIIRFLRVHNYLTKQNQEFPEDSNLQNLLMLMEDALESSNVHLYNPEVGGDYRSVEGLAENPEIIETDDESQDFKIKNVVKPGYFLKYDQNKEFVQDAVVSIFSYVREEE